MSVQVQVTGAKEIENCLKALPLEVSHAIMGAANLKAAQPLIAREKELAPLGATGNLRDSIVGVKVSQKRAEVGLVIVGPSRKGKRKGFGAHFVEFGTKQRRTKKGSNRGQMKPEPFIEPAFNQTKEKVIANITTETAKKIVSRMKRELKGNFV